MISSKSLSHSGDMAEQTNRIVENDVDDDDNDDEDDNDDDISVCRVNRKDRWLDGASFGKLAMRETLTFPYLTIPGIRPDFETDSLL